MEFPNVVIDISHYEDPVNFQEVQSDGIVAVISKATHGLTGLDKTHNPRREKAKALGFLWGSYHFGTGVGDGTAQAKHFLSHIGVPNGDFLSLDFEPNVDGNGNPLGPNMTLAQAREFVQEVNRQLGRYPFLYGGHFLKEQLGNQSDPILAKCPLWLAQYAKEGEKPTWPKNWDTWTLWQYTDGKAGAQPHTVTGIGRCDRNYYINSEADLKARWPLT